jgi:MFS transporter, DHA2 family, methylenomycin A resistance protein
MLNRALVAVCLGYFMVILDATIVNVALPALHDDLGASVSGLQWVVDGYTLPFAALLLSAGAVGDRVGNRRMFAIGLVAFGAASAACASSPSVPALVAARVVQGAGAAIMVPSSLALLRAAYEGQAERARAIGIWGAIAGIAAVSGPILGGALVTALSWRAVFAVNVPVVAATMVLAARHVPVARGNSARSLDPAGQAASILGLVGLTFALIELNGGGITDPPVLAGIVIFPLAALAFVYTEHRTRDPMLPPALLRRPTLAGGSLVGLLINLAFYGQLFVINLYLQQVRGYSPLLAGIALIPMGITISLSSAASGRLSARSGPRPVMLGGLLLAAVGMAGLATVGADTPYALLALPMAAAGSGMALTMPAATTAVIEASPADRAGLAAGIINASRQVGSVIGVALLGSLVGTSGVSIPWMHVALAIAAATFVLAALTAYLTVDRRGWPGLPRLGRARSSRLRRAGGPALRRGSG